MHVKIDVFESFPFYFSVSQFYVFILYLFFFLLFFSHNLENRPWSNINTRWSRSQCQGYDFCHHDPRVRMRFFWNDQTEVRHVLLQDILKSLHF